MHKVWSALDDKNFNFLSCVKIIFIGKILLHIRIVLLQALLEQQNLEKSKFLSHIQTLEKELLCLSASSLVKEKESFRRDLEKTKTKLKETEFKLKNVIQEKTKLEV